MAIHSAGANFRAALAADTPLQVVGAITAYAARMAERVGFKAVYLSGGGVAANSLGMPDLGISTMEDVLIDATRITEVCALPLLVDIDTGWGGAFNIARTIKTFTRAGVAPCTWKIRSALNAAAIVPAKRWSPRKKWWIASRPRLTQKLILISSSWRAPMRSPLKG